MRPLALLLFVLVPLTAQAKGPSDPVTKFCGVEPKRDPGHNAPIKVQERLLNRLLTTRGRVFRAFKHNYESNRTRIIRRNKKLPKSQHLPVPPAKTDDQLRAMDDYKRKEDKAHASPAKEAQLKAKLGKEVAKRNSAQKVFEACRDRILTRIRTAGSKSAEAIRKIPAAKRLKEERQRLDQLREQFLAMLESKRKDKKTMVPIISASICAHKNLKRQTDRELKALERETGARDLSAEIQAATERREEHALEVTELKRDLKLMKARPKRCGRSLRPLVGCIEAHRRTAARPIPPAQCNAFLIELELLGYSKRRWD